MTGAQNYDKLYLPGAIVLAGAFIGLGLFFGLGSGGGAPAAAGQQLITTKAQMQKLVGKHDANVVIDTAHAKKGGDIFIGKADAPLTMSYWFDYQCPFCQQFELNTMPQIIEQYVNTGKLKIVLKDYPFLGQDSLIDAEYSHAVWDLYPDKFFAWHTAMYEVQDAEGDQGFGDAATVDILTGLIPGIDAAKVKAAVAANKDAYDALIAAEQQAGVDAGVQGTPGFLTGTTLIPGAVPFSDFKTAIDAQLK
jgi:protein-disulfide isomerase